MVFMMSAIVLLGIVMLLEANPVLDYLRAELAGEAPSANPWMIASLAAAMAVCLAATIVPIRLGLKKIEGMEF
jgi:hypothetical protein